MRTPFEQTHLRFESLLEIGQLLMSAMEPEAVLQGILDSAIRLFAVEGCSIALIDEAARQLAFVQMAGPARVEEFRIGMEQGIAGWVARMGQGVVSNEVAQDPRFFGGIDLQTGFTTRSILCAPLKHRDRILGVIQALNTTQPGGFTPEDLQLLMALGGVAGTAITHTRAFAMLRNASAAFQEVVQDRYRLIIGTSPAMQEALRLAGAVAATDTTVLLLGESGTGKEVVARAIHQWSRRAENPFVAVNCVALTPELLASELFGHEKGAFTGAIAQKKGKFELAEGGTLFLDEIGELAPDLQAKLLRVLQEKEFQRVGGVKDLRANVRILAATNRDLRQAMRTGAFREDLYYRLNVVAISLPPLRDRPEDLLGLVQHFLERYGREMSRPRLGMDPSALELLRAYPWPGNVRELQNVIERALVLSPGPEITVADLPAEIRQAALAVSGLITPLQEIEDSLPLVEAVKAFKRLRILQALERAGGNQEQAARLLGLARPNLSRLMKNVGLR